VVSRKRVEWDDEAKASAYVIWISNGKSIRQTARDTGIPVSTVSYWGKDWEKNGPPDNLNEKIANNVYEFVAHASSVREKAMQKLEELIPEAEVKQLSAIATVVGIMDDKIRLASGLATKRTETVHTLPTKEEMKELMGGFASSLVDAAQDRSEEVVEIEASSVVVNN
jgi:transposase-like protein